LSNLVSQSRSSQTAIKVEKKEVEEKPKEKPEEKGVIKDSTGAVFNPEIHAEKDGKPSLTKSGKFRKKTRKKAAKVEPISGFDESKYVEQKEAKPEENKTTSSATMNFSGKMLLTMIDVLIPAIIGMGVKRFKGKKIDVEKLRMTKEERELLEESADAVSAELIGTMSPTSQFLLGLGLIYGSKTIDLITSE